MLVLDMENVFQVGNCSSKVLIMKTMGFIAFLMKPKILKVGTKQTFQFIKIRC